MNNKKKICGFLTGCLITSFPLQDSVVLANENIKNNAIIHNQSDKSNENYIFLSDLPYIKEMSNTSWGSIKINQNIDGGKITLNVDGEALQFDKGIGAHANSNLVYDVSNYSDTYSRFTTYVGVDRSQWDKGNGIKVTVFASNDGKTWTELAKTDVLKGNTNAAFIDVDIKDFKYLKLTANDNGSNGNDHAVYGSPRIMKADYDISSEYLAGVKKVEYYDQLIKSKYNINSPITGEYERLLLQRTFVKRVGFNTIQSVAKLGSKYENAINWLVNNDNALKLYVTGGEIEGGGSYATSMKALADIYEKHNSDFSDTANGELYLKMAIATSISHAKTIRLWTGNATPSDPCTRYEIYKNLYTSGLMAEGGNTELFKNLPVELMRWVMDNKIDDEEINWLVNHALANKASGGNYLDAYTYIRYTSGFNYNKDKYYEESRYDEWNKKYNISSLSDYGKKGVHKLWMVFEEGSVCGGLAKTYANLSQVFGMPAAVVGQPGHAATLSYSQNSEGKGIWSIKNDISGWVQSEKGERLPLGWGSKDWDSYYSVSYILLAQKALDDYDNLIKAEYYNYLADVYKNDAEKQIEIYNKALGVQNYNLDSLVGLINAYKQAGNKTSSDYLELSKRVAEGLAFFPLPFVDVMKLIEPNITNASDKVIFDMLKTKTLKNATMATDKDTVQPNACKTMAKHLLGENNIELATFSFDGENAGKIKINDIYSNSSIRWEYSLDGWKTKKETDTKEITLSKEELEKINKDDDIQISLVGTSEIYKIDITQYEAPRNLYVNDLENQFRGFNGNLEYSEDNGATWNKYDAENTRILGNKKVLVRYIASGTKMQSEPVEYSFTEDNQPANRKYIQLKNVSLYKYSSQENNGDAAAKNMIDGNINTGWHNTWKGESDKFYTVEFDKPRYVTSIEYKPSGHNGILKNVDIYTSMDGVNWEKSGEVRNLRNDYNLKVLNLSKPTKAKFVKLQAVNTYGNPNDVFFTGRMLNFFEDTTKENMPVISGADNLKIKEGTAFDPMTGVSAKDTEDGDLTPKVQVKGAVDVNKPGEYELLYSVVDKDGNKTEVKRKVKVNPKLVEINNVPTISCEDKTIKAGEDFNPLTGVSASDKEDGDITSSLKVVTNEVNTKVPGKYKVVYEVTDKDGAKTSKTITVTVVSNDSPVISGAEDLVLKEGTAFDPMTGVSAKDTEDGDLTSKVQLKGTVDVNKPGEYELTYSVVDKDGNKTEVKRVVKVNSKLVEINNVPTISVEDKTIKAGEDFDPLAGVTAKDKEDGDLTSSLKVVTNEVNTKVPGKYKVVYEVTDKGGAKTSKTITVTVVSNDSPVISGVENLVLKEGTAFDPMTGVTAKDTEDGDLTSKVQVKGTVDVNKPGEYELLYSVVDKDGNKTEVKRKVKVNPKLVEINNVPTISCEDKTIKAGEDFNPLAGVTASDKEDGDLTSSLKVVTNEVNTKVPGTYKVVYEVTDNQGAKTSKTITVTVLSNDLPVISGADNITIKEGTEFDAMSGIKANDTEDGDLTSKVEVKGSVDANKPGEYELVYTVVDKDGNKTEVKRIVKVNPKLVEINSMPILSGENKIIKVGEDFDPLSGITASDKEDGDITSNIKVVTNEVNTKIPGTYKVVYEVTDNQGAKTSKTITVTVLKKISYIQNKLPNTGMPINIPYIGGFLIILGTLLKKKKR
ncbi:TPA: DUF5011 domain-containing protein [Clostridium perfringens]|nr:DUF5011 domain-containing protein [Clostridium perfringens]